MKEELKTEVTKIKNKIIALSDLDEQSNGKTLKEIIEKKLFDDERIKKNLIGFVHDNGSSLVGENIGLASLLKQDNLHFFDLKDPCHGLNLVLKHSINSLPDDIMKFVQSISNHFASPQRKALLRKIQEEIGKKSLCPKKLAATRWLSTGESLIRIIEIWNSLVYFKVLSSREKPAKKTKRIRRKTEPKGNDQESKNLKSKDILKLLNDKVFYMKIILLSHITTLTNII